MMVKIVINDIKTGKSYQKEFDMELFSGKKIGDKFQGDVLGLKDYEFLITGGSDNAGFPLNDSFDSPIRKKILVCRKGVKLRKNVRGNQFGDYMAQISLKVVKYGSGDLSKIIGVEKKDGEAEKEVKQPEKVEKAQVEVKKEEKKPEEKPKVEEKPKEETKPEVKKE